MSSLMVSISGVRGVVGESLTPEVVLRWGQAFGTYVEGGRAPSPDGLRSPPKLRSGGGRVVVGRDTRVSGEMVKHSVLAGLLSAGCGIIDLGVVTTPTAAIMIEELGADGGVVISASHNPVEWNALKFFNADGQYLDAAEGRALLEVSRRGEFQRAKWHGIREVERNDRAADAHLKRVFGIVDVEAIRRRRFRVALDSCNGAGVEITARMLTELGCELVRIHCTPDGLFPHDPEPTFENLQDLCRLVRSEKGVDAAFAQDPDADRLAVVNEAGDFIGEEYTLALVADYVLSGFTVQPFDRLTALSTVEGGSGFASEAPKAPQPGTVNREPGTPVVVINMSTSRVIEDICARRGAKCDRVAVGEVNVARRMRELGAVIGGEGNGGVIDPRVHLGRDSLVGMVLILEAMAKRGRKLSELVAELPRYTMIKTKVECPPQRLAAAVAAIRRAGEGSGAKANDLDGLRLDWPDAWVHVRASNTEPVVRVIGEAPDERRAREVVGAHVELVRRTGAQG
jgi:phosphomannomutase